MWVDAGATLGGTVAAGVSGPGRFRFGGVRDFILGVRFVDGQGRLLRMGGKVVKNCAGFDLPKFFVGSLGRFGVLAEVTFKVFPAPASRLTLKLDDQRRRSRRPRAHGRRQLALGARRPRSPARRQDRLPASGRPGLRPGDASRAKSWPAGRGRPFPPPRRTPRGLNCASSAGRTPAVCWSKWPSRPLSCRPWMRPRVRSMARAFTSAPGATWLSFPCHPPFRRPPCKSGCARWSLPGR